MRNLTRQAREVALAVGASAAESSSFRTAQNLFPQAGELVRLGEGLRALTQYERARSAFLNAATQALASGEGVALYGKLWKEVEGLSERAGRFSFLESESVRGALERAREAFDDAKAAKGRDDTRALVRLVEARTAYEQAIAQALSLPEGRATQARLNMEAARERAQRARAEKLAEDLYRQASAAAETAERAWQRGRVAEAERAYREAAETFDRAWREAQLAADPERAAAIQAKQSMLKARRACEALTHMKRSYYDLGLRAQSIAERWMQAGNFKKARSNFETATKFYRQAAGR